MAAGMISLWPCARGGWRPILAAIICALAGFFSTCALAEVHIDGEPAALSVEARDTTVQEVLAVLAASRGLKYRTSVDLSRPISGVYKGSLQNIVSRLLDGYNYFVRNSDHSIEVV